MANIDPYLAAILNARYGEEVRGAIHDAIKESNDEIVDYGSTASAAAESAADSATAAAASETDAENAATAAANSQTSAATSAENAAASASEAATVTANASTYATMSESYAKGGTGSRPGEDTDNAKYYYQQARSIAGGGMRYVATVTFEELLQMVDMDTNEVYTVSTAGQTTNLFTRPGENYPAGTSFVYTSAGLWHPLDGDNLDANAGTMSVTFTSSDTVDEDQITSWTDFVAMTSGGLVSSLMAILSKVARNVRYLWKKVRTSKVELTAAEYQELVDAGTVDPWTDYYITDEGIDDNLTASAVTFTPTSTIAAATVQSAVQTVDSNLRTLISGVGAPVLLATLSQSSATATFDISQYKWIALLDGYAGSDIYGDGIFPASFITDGITIHSQHTGYGGSVKRTGNTYTLSAGSGVSQNFYIYGIR